MSKVAFQSAINSNAVNDNQFYKSLVRLYAKTLQECFERYEMPKVILELERLFKTNAFNEVKR